MAILQRKLSDGTWSVMAQAQDFPVKIPLADMEYATGTATTDANALCEINCGFDPDIIIIEGGTYVENGATFYPNIELAMYRLPAASSSIKADGISWGVFPWAGDNDFIKACAAYKIHHGASLYLYTYTYDMDYRDCARATFTWKAYKFMGGAT